jgi:TonB family protein
VSTLARSHSIQARRSLLRARRARPTPARGHPGRGALLGAGLLIALAGLPMIAGAQSGNEGMTITVRDSTGIGIAGAELIAVGGPQKVTSDEQGVFHVVGLIAGRSTFRIRRLGFRPESVVVDVQPGSREAREVVLQRVAQTLAPVVVQGSLSTQGRLAGFWQRRLNGNGRFFTRAEIDRRNLLQMTDLFRMIPGMNLTASGVGRTQLRMRGASQSCWPLVWLDGNPLGAAEFDMDNIQPNTVEALEVYSGPASVPAQFMGPRGLGACGVVVVWTRDGERRPKKIKNAVTAAQLADMVASLKVFTADQVEHPVQSDSSLFAAPQYPDSLFAAGAPGRVVAEFVVDTLGRVEPETFGVVLSTHRMFSESVRRAVIDARFEPASREGKHVRQVVQLPFKFVPDSSVTKHSRP